MPNKQTKKKVGELTAKERKESIARYMKLSKMDLAIMLTEANYVISIISGERKIPSHVANK